MISVDTLAASPITGHAIAGWMSNLTIGVVSGLLSTLLVFLAVFLYQKLVRPKLEELLYHGVSIAGEWQLANDDGGALSWSQFETISIEQSAHRISGVVTLTARDSEDAEVRVLTLEGEIRDRFVFGRMRSSVAHQVAHVVFLAEVTAGGGKLTGQAAIYNTIDGAIDAGKIQYVRRDTKRAG
jgi:hypothetical protein